MKYSNVRVDPPPSALRVLVGRRAQHNQIEIERVRLRHDLLHEGGGAAQEVHLDQSMVDGTVASAVELDQVSLVRDERDKVQVHLVRKTRRLSGAR